MLTNKHPQRPPKWFRRKQWYERLIREAPTADAAMLEAWRWLRSNAKHRAELDPKKADALYREITMYVAKIAEAVPRMKVDS